MTLKWNRESILVILTGAMILIGLFFYGNRYLVQPVQEEADALTHTVETQQRLIENYPPSEKLLAEYEDNYSQTENFLPRGVEATTALVTLEQLADSTNVTVSTISRVEQQQTIEGVSEDFAKNIYTVEMTSDYSANFRELINQLVEEERVWNISSFAYDKIEEENYTGSFNFELYYYVE